MHAIKKYLHKYVLLAKFRAIKHIPISVPVTSVLDRHILFLLLSRPKNSIASLHILGHNELCSFYGKRTALPF
jgi:hypothetical protein